MFKKKKRGNIGKEKEHMEQIENKQQEGKYGGAWLAQ